MYKKLHFRSIGLKCICLTVLLTQTKEIEKERKKIDYLRLLMYKNVNFRFYLY